MVKRKFIGSRRKRKNWKKNKTRKRSKSNFRKRVAKISKAAVFKALNNTRRYVKEFRGLSLVSSAGKIEYICPFKIGCRESFEALINNTTGQDGAATGSASDKHRTFKISDYTGYYRMRNMSPHPVYITAWEVVPKQHVVLISGTESRVEEHLLETIRAGWKLDLDDTADGYCSEVTSDTDNNLNRAYMEVNSSFLFPTHSSRFSSEFKIVKKKTFKLQSGGIAHFSLKIGNFNYRANQWKEISDADQGSGVEAKTGITKSAIKNITKYLLLRVHGEIGHGVTNQDQTGFMEVDFACIATEKASVCEIAQKDRVLGIRLEDDTLAESLEGPSRRIMVTEG